MHYMDSIAFRTELEEPAALRRGDLTEAEARAAIRPVTPEELETLARLCPQVWGVLAADRLTNDLETGVASMVGPMVLPMLVLVVVGLMVR